MPSSLDSEYIRQVSPQPVIAITGGGTGGHVYPGLAVADALGALSPSHSLYAGDLPGVSSASEHSLPPESRSPSALARSQPSARVLWIGSRGGMERDLVEREGLLFVPVATGAVRGKGLLGKGSSAALLVSGIAQALGLLRRQQVSVILATGGYVSAPVVLAGWLERIPALIYLPDVEPGLAVQFLSRFARRIAVTSEQSIGFLPRRKVVVTGYPLRARLLAADRAESRRQLALRPDDKVLLVLGGSRGAHSINQAIAGALPELLTKTVVIHSSGPQDEPSLREMAATLPADLKDRYRLFAYLYEDLGAVMGAADLAISRAGASVMGEYPAFGLPSILVPYPFAGAHQHHNAAYLVGRGAAMELADADLSQGLLPAVNRLLCDDACLASMSQAAKSLARPHAAHAIAQELLKLC